MIRPLALPQEDRPLKKFVLLACAFAAAVWAVTMPLSCGPQQKFCPDASDGVCTEPAQQDSGTGTNGDSIFLET
jgi:hypothetical protein